MPESYNLFCRKYMCHFPRCVTGSPLSFYCEADITITGEVQILSGNYLLAGVDGSDHFFYEFSKLNSIYF